MHFVFVSFVAKDLFRVNFEALLVLVLAKLVPYFVEHRTRELLLRDLDDMEEILLGLASGDGLFLVDAVLHLDPQQPFAPHEVDQHVEVKAPDHDDCKHKCHRNDDVRVVNEDGACLAVLFKLLNLLSSVP